NECFVLLPVLGVAPFFIGRLLDLASSDLPESRFFPPGWGRRAIVALLVGLTIIVSFAIDVYGLPKAGGWLRVAAIVFYLAARLPFRGSAFLANCLRIGLVSIGVGFVTVALFPLYRVGALHIVFIIGFGFVVFTVATRVVFGHGGYLSQVRSRMPF